MISTKGRYSIRAVVDIALNEKNGPVSVADISNRLNISTKYLEQTISLLVKADIVKPLRGKYGGYVLNKEPKDITIYEVLVAEEGTLAPVKCLECEVNECENMNSCSALTMWEEYDRLTNEFFKGKTIKDLL